MMMMIETDRQTDRDTDRHTDPQTGSGPRSDTAHTHTDRQTDRQTYRDTDRHTHPQTGSGPRSDTAHTHTYRQTDRQTDRHTYRQTYRGSSKWTWSTVGLRSMEPSVHNFHRNWFDVRLFWFSSRHFYQYSDKSLSHPHSCFYQTSIYRTQHQ